MSVIFRSLGAEFLFTPQYYNEVPLIVQQAKQLGWKKPILGSDSWSSDELVKLCGKDCLGSFFVSHYASAGAKGATKEFIDRYKAKYGYTPDDVAALTWDATRIVLQAIQEAGALTGKLQQDRGAIRKAMDGIKSFAGITGDMKFDAQGRVSQCSGQAALVIGAALPAYPCRSRT